MKTTEDQSDEISERDTMSAPAASPITEAQVIEFLCACAKTLLSQTGTSLASVQIEVSQYGGKCGDHVKATRRVYTHDTGSYTGCETIEEGIAHIVAASAPAALAEAKRRQAQALLAEADALAPVLEAKEAA